MNAAPATRTALTGTSDHSVRTACTTSARTAVAARTIAATAGYLVVAGGRDASGAIVPDVEVFDVETLERVATLPMLVPRAGATARPLPNQQVLIAGGVDASGAPVATIELFTPTPPELP